MRQVASGGILPYTYSIDGNNFQSSNTFDNLSAGTYTITIRDAIGANVFVIYNLTEPDALSLEAIVQNDAITINTSGGTPPYQYSLDGSDFQTSNQFFNLADTDFTFDVLDANQCLETITASVSFTPLTGTSEITQEIDCVGNESGEIEATASGGIAPYTYSLDGITFQNQSTFANLGNGVYTIIIRDSDGIEFNTNAVTLNNPPAILVSIDQDERSITANATGGTDNLTYSIDNVDFQSSNVFNGLVNGEYTLYVRDSRNCIVELDFNILFNDIIGISSIAQQITCHDANDGMIAVESAGGTAPREFSIDNGATYQSSNFFENLAAGEYTVIVRDADGLTITSNAVVIVNPDEINISITVDGNDASVNANGGTGNLTYSIDGLDFSNNSTFENLINGIYTAYVRDANDCLVSENFEINIDALGGTATIVGENLCFGDFDTGLQLQGNGGTPPYQYSIDGGQNFGVTDFFASLGAGIYSIVIRDDNGTIFNLQPTEILQPDLLTLVSQVDAGNVSLTPQGGTPPYSYSLDGSDFQASEVFTGLPNGNYTAIVQDANDCAATADFSINVIAPLSQSIEIIDILDCTGQIAGNIQVTGSGGTPPYEFSLDNGPFQSSGLFENVAPGDHQVSIRDASMATITNPVTLTTPSPLELDIIITDNDVEINVQGGIPPYDYSIDAGQSFSTERFFTDLELGDYEVIVEDDNGCVVSELFSIITVSVGQIDQSLIFSLQPNPANGSTSLFLDANTAQDIQISLVDILGRTVRIFETNQINDEYELDINGVVPGTYLLQVDIDGRTAVKKLVVQ